MKILKKYSALMIAAVMLIMMLSLCAISITYAETSDDGDTVTASELKKEIKDSILGNWYGSKKISFTAEPGTTGKITAGTKVYKYTAGKSGKVSVKLKKVYPLNTKLKITAKAGDAETVINGKFKSATKLYEAYSKSGMPDKTLCLRMYNLHKGDKVKVTYKGKTVTKTIKKDYDGRSRDDVTISVKLKKKLTFDAALKIKVVNKDSKKLLSKSIKLSNFSYYR